jgi:hypothetical protein
MSNDKTNKKPAVIAAKKITLGSAIPKRPVAQASKPKTKK